MMIRPRPPMTFRPHPGSCRALIHWQAAVPLSWGLITAQGARRPSLGPPRRLQDKPVAYNCFCVPLPGSPTAKPFCAIGSAVNIQRQKIPRVLPGGASTRGSSQGEQLEGHHPKRDRDSRQTAISLRSCDAAATSPHRRCALCSRRGLGQSERVQVIKRSKHGTSM